MKCVCNNCDCTSQLDKPGICHNCKNQQCEKPIDERCRKCKKGIIFSDHNYVLCGAYFYHKNLDCIPVEYQEAYLEL